MNDEPYVGVITIRVDIPAELIEGEMRGTDYEEIEERMLADAEWQLQTLVYSFREAARG